MFFIFALRAAVTEELKMLTPPLLSQSFFQRLVDVKRCFGAPRTIEEELRTDTWVLDGPFWLVVAGNYWMPLHLRYDSSPDPCLDR